MTFIETLRPWATAIGFFAMLLFSIFVLAAVWYSAIESLKHKFGKSRPGPRGRVNGHLWVVTGGANGLRTRHLPSRDNSHLRDGA